VPSGDGHRPGDWDCPACGNLVFGSKLSCTFKLPRSGGRVCGAKKAVELWDTKGWECFVCGRQQVGRNEYCQCGASSSKSNWNCAKCGVVVLASTESCNFRFSGGRICGGLRSEGRPGACPDKKDKPRPRQPGDWDCPSCGNLVFAGKERCLRKFSGGRVCGAKMPENVQADIHRRMTPNATFSSSRQLEGKRVEESCSEFNQEQRKRKRGSMGINDICTIRK